MKWLTLYHQYMLVFMSQAASFWQRLLQAVGEYLKEETEYDLMAKAEDMPALLESDDDDDPGEKEFP